MRGMWLGLLLVGAGCSSLENVGLELSGYSPQAACQPFGGVRTSTERVSQGLDSLARNGLQFYLPVVTECIGLAVLADVPCSLVGDLLTLPWCLYCTNTVKPMPPSD
jgi:hypothetical protein